MKIVIPLRHINTLDRKDTGVWGEEIVANAVAKDLCKHGHEVDVREVNDVIDNPCDYDLAIYMTYNIVYPWRVKKISKHSILWIQGFEMINGSVISLDSVYVNVTSIYDMVITSSRRLAKMKNIPFVLPMVDFDEYYPVEKDKVYDISFIGNIIKPFSVNERFIRPFSDFNYRLCGGDFGKISHREWLEVVGSSKINLHYGFKEGRYWDMVTGRPLFLAACKGFCMCDKIPYFEEKFKDVFVFTNGGKDEVEKIQYYLNNSTERNERTEKAYEIVRGLDFTKLSEIIKGGF